MTVTTLGRVVMAILTDNKVFQRRSSFAGHSRDYATRSYVSRVLGDQGRRDGADEQIDSWEDWETVVTVAISFRKCIIYPGNLLSACRVSLGRRIRNQHFDVRSCPAIWQGDDVLSSISRPRQLRSGRRCLAEFGLAQLQVQLC